MTAPITRHVGFGVLVSVAAHVLLGWQWSCLGGFLAGVLYPSRGWLVGLLAVGLGWTSLVLYSLTVAPGPVLEMFRVVGHILAGADGWVVPTVTVALACILGCISGVLGASIRKALN